MFAANWSESFVSPSDINKSNTSTGITARNCRVTSYCQHNNIQLRDLLIC